MSTGTVGVVDQSGAGTKKVATTELMIGGQTVEFQNMMLADQAGVTLATIKPASTAPVATDTAIVVSLRDAMTLAGTLPAFAATPTFNMGLLNGASTAALQAAINADGGSQVHVMNFPATQPVSAAGSSYVDGWDATQGLKADAAWTSGSGSVVAILKAVDRDLLLPTPAGTNTIGNVNQTLATAGFGKVTDGTNTAAVKAASTAAVAGDAALVVAISPNNTVAITGTVTINAIPGGSNTIGNVIPVGSATATGALTIGNTVSSAATNNATALKASAGRLYGGTVVNTQATARYLKFYNLAVAPTPASSTVALAILVPGNSSVSISSLMPSVGMFFGAGIAYAMVANPSLTDNTSIVAGDLLLSLLYL